MVLGLLRALAALVEEHGLWSTRALAAVAPGVYSTGSVVVVRGLGAPRPVGSSRMKDRTRVSCIKSQCTEPPGKPSNF